MATSTYCSRAAGSAPSTAPVRGLQRGEGRTCASRIFSSMANRWRLSSRGTGSAGGGCGAQGAHQLAHVERRQRQPLQHHREGVRDLRMRIVLFSAGQGPCFHVLSHACTCLRVSVGATGWVHACCPSWRHAPDTSTTPFVGSGKRSLHVCSTTLRTQNSTGDAVANSIMGNARMRCAWPG